ncbi:MAG TPA: hypothetical protein VEU08_14570 [Vicinamibacterales bacterium]|nr:hypothetical protein [Vicinamibacterales bacterium]
MNIAEHEAWEQILSVARNANLSCAGELARMYLDDGGHDHVPVRLGIQAAEPQPEPKPEPIAATEPIAEPKSDPEPPAEQP